MPQRAVVGEEFEMTFHCMFADPSLCPPRYLVMFDGPSRQTIRPEMFQGINTTDSSPFSYGKASVRWTLFDEGVYTIYAYPDFDACAQWNSMKYPFQKASVEGAPFLLTVHPAQYPWKEGYGICSGEDVRDGRYLPVTSPQLASSFSNVSQNFAWAPYNCKIAPRTATQAVAELPKAQHIVFVGDSTTRGPFCRFVWGDIHGDLAGSPCEFGTENYWEMKWGHKFTSHVFEDNRNVSFSFIWAPEHPESVLNQLKALDPLPTHLIFNVGMYTLFQTRINARWVTWEDFEGLGKYYMEFLNLVKDNLADSVEHVILKTTVSSVKVSFCLFLSHSTGC